MTEDNIFRKWLLKNYGLQDAEAYKGTQTEEIAKRYATECVKASQEEIAKNVKFILVNDMNIDGLKANSYANSDVAVTIDKSSITDSKNIVLL